MLWTIVRTEEDVTTVGRVMTFLRGSLILTRGRETAAGL